MRRCLICLLLALWPSVVHAAEPLTLILIHIIRQQIANAVESAIEQAQRERERPVHVIPRAPYDLDEQHPKGASHENLFQTIEPAARDHCSDFCLWQCRQERRRLHD